MIRVLGDINFADWYFDKGKGVGTSISMGKNPFIHLNMKSDDYWIGNFECVCADSIDKSFVMSPELLDRIPHMNLYGVANNHSMQIGETGYLQTIDFLENKKIKYCGSLEKKNAKFIHQNKTIGIIAFSMRPDNFSKNPLYWHLPELSDIENEEEKLEDCDYRIAFVHWGYEFINRPNIEQRLLGHWLIDIGFDLVVGMHPHVAQGTEKYKGGYIAYSLGNAVFNMAWNPTKYGFLLNVDLSGKTPKIWRDYIKIGDDFFPKIVNLVPDCFSKDYLDSLVTINTENEKYFAEAASFAQQYTKVNRKDILKRMISMPPKEQIALVRDFFNRRFLKR